MFNYYASFNQENMFVKLDMLSDLLANAICKSRDNWELLTDAEKIQAKNDFLNGLEENGMVITDEVIKAVEEKYESSPMADMLKEYIATNSVYSEVVEQLQPERKVTMVMFTEFGFPNAVQTTVKEISVKPYAQYKEALYIIHKPKGKRSEWVNIILPHNDIMIYEGWINVDINGITKNTDKYIKYNQLVTVTQSKYGCFDRRYMSDLLNAIDKQPLAVYKPEMEVSA
ncbi:hypothetical protein [Paenibacillus medicaginis]|uniref:Uncharacterized protein n=1 Tax=Paenibacillus medicaginis TaxID=1470560 RepID=A0ABV5BVP0_9BACL